MRNLALLKNWFFLFSFLLFLPLHGYAQQWQWSGVERIVAVSDIHGAYDSFVDVLNHAGIVDAQLNWSGGRTHLVIVGDVLDRGPKSRRALDLIMKLESEAGAEGGMVHMVLGNHEVMDMTGDLAYVSNSEYASYADEEEQAWRQAAYSRFKKNAGADTGNDEVLRTEFEKKYPRGFFGHRRMFSSRGKYGRWLMNKPVMLRINNTLFVHGGLSKYALEFDGDSLNNAYAQLLKEYLDDWSVLADAGILNVEEDFYDHDRILKTYLSSQSPDNTGGSSQLNRVAKRLLELNNSPLFRMQSPIWYRGNVGCNEVLGAPELDEVLKHFKAVRLVIGHTPTPNHEVLNRYNGKLIRIDTGMLHSYFGGRGSALVIKSGEVTAIYSGRKGQFKLETQPRMTGVRPDMMSDEDLERLLSQAPILDNTRIDHDRHLLKLGYEGKQLDAVFIPARNKGRNKLFIPEVAAYRFDKLLGIDMVPVAVSRPLDGEPGAVSLNQDSLVNERIRNVEKQGGGAWCPLDDQFGLMYVFDMLVYNEGRTPEEIRYNSNNWQLVLTGNRKLFAAKNSKPYYLKKAPVNLSMDFISRLRALNDGLLSDRLGDVLDKRRIGAILKRRDVILKSAGIVD